ncbi:hypothetical protein [Bradyrhizobium neotropicale]|nr:hypothetical protein [Bradyrhizobium neotropicale]MBO4227699.1 hypothetical protein [Bradyrhizobium neotropicale]
MSKRRFGLSQAREITVTPREKRDMPYIVGLARLAAAMMIAFAAFGR